MKVRCVLQLQVKFKKKFSGHIFLAIFIPKNIQISKQTFFLLIKILFIEARNAKNITMYLDWKSKVFRDATVENTPTQDRLLKLSLQVEENSAECTLVPTRTGRLNGLEKRSSMRSKHTKPE